MCVCVSAVHGVATSQKIAWIAQGSSRKLCAQLRVANTSGSTHETTSLTHFFRGPASANALWRPLRRLRTLTARAFGKWGSHVKICARRDLAQPLYMDMESKSQYFKDKHARNPRNRN